MDTEYLNDLHNKLKNGWSIQQVRNSFFTHKQREIVHYSSVESLSFQVAKLKLKEIGLDLKKEDEQESFAGYKYWKFPLDHTTITINTSWNHKGIYIKYFQETSDLLYITADIKELTSILKKADESYPEFLREWAEIEKECNKYLKVKELSENAIVALVQEKLKGTGLEYNLTLENAFVLLKVRMKRGRFFELRIHHDKFQELLTDSLVEEIKTISETCDGISCDFRVGRYGNNVTWYKSE